MAFSISAWRRWSGLQVQGAPLTVGDESVIAVGGKQGQLWAEVGCDPADDEPYRYGVGLTLKGGISCLRHIGGRPPSSTGWASSPPREWPR